MQERGIVQLNTHQCSHAGESSWPAALHALAWNPQEGMEWNFIIKFRQPWMSEPIARTPIKDRIRTTHAQIWWVWPITPCCLKRSPSGREQTLRQSTQHSHLPPHPSSCSHCCFLYQLVLSQTHSPCRTVVLPLIKQLLHVRHIDRPNLHSITALLSFLAALHSVSPLPCAARQPLSHSVSAFAVSVAINGQLSNAPNSHSLSCGVAAGSK